MRKGGTVVVSCRCRGMNSQLSERDSWTVSPQVPPLGSQLCALMCFCHREKPCCYLVTTTPLHCGTPLLYFTNYLSGYCVGLSSSVFLELVLYYDLSSSSFVSGLLR